jgi:hypothetical protein
LTINGKTVADDLLFNTTEGPAKLTKGAPDLIKRSTYTVLCGHSLLEKAGGYIPPEKWWAYETPKVTRYIGSDPEKQGNKYLLCSFAKGTIPENSPKGTVYLTLDGRIVPTEEVSPFIKESSYKPFSFCLGLGSIVNIQSLTEYNAAASKAVKTAVPDGLPF